MAGKACWASSDVQTIANNSSMQNAKTCCKSSLQAENTANRIGNVPL